ncbi:MAG: thioesterase family protein [Desulfobacterales bacterium]|jgi:thioesterase-3
MTPITEIKIRGYHLDVYGHVNNARYLEFLEEARWALFEEHFDIERWQERNLGFFIVSITIQYRKPVLLGDVLRIGTYVSRFGTKSAVFTQQISSAKSGQPVAEADITFVLADLKTGRAVPIDGELKEALERFCPDGDCSNVTEGPTPPGR